MCVINSLSARPKRRDSQRFDLHPHLIYQQVLHARFFECNIADDLGRERTQLKILYRQPTTEVGCSLAG